MFDHNEVVKLTFIYVGLNQRHKLIEINLNAAIEPYAIVNGQIHPYKIDSLKDSLKAPQKSLNDSKEHVF